MSTLSARVPVLHLFDPASLAGVWTTLSLLGAASALLLGHMLPC